MTTAPHRPLERYRGGSPVDALNSMMVSTLGAGRGLSSDEIVEFVLRSIREPSEAAVDGAMTKHTTTIAEGDTERARADFRRKFRSAIDAMLNENRK